MDVAGGVSYCRNCLFLADYLSFFASKKVDRLSDPALAGLAGRELFPFGCFEHRIMASGTGYASLEGTADAGGDAGFS